MFLSLCSPSFSGFLCDIWRVANPIGVIQGWITKAASGKDKYHGGVQLDVFGVQTQ